MYPNLMLIFFQISSWTCLPPPPHTRTSKVTDPLKQA